jgi:NADPH:quinone reductase-like Zn-dependent oxidoreductase
MRIRRVVITKQGGPEVLRLIEDDLPNPKPGEVRVKVLATGVSFADMLMRLGLYRAAPPPPFSPGYDIAGEVNGKLFVALTVTGGYAEYMNLPESELVPVPDGVEPADAVCMVLNYVTAYQLLHRAATVGPGAKVLVRAAAGGVGTAVLQLGRLAKLEMYGTASARKHELVASLGATAIEHSGKLPQVDLALDPIGGVSWWRSHQALRKHGQLVVYGISAALSPQGTNRPAALGSFALLGLFKAIPDGRPAHFYNITTLKREHPDWFRADLIKLLDLLAAKQITPMIAERLPLVEAARAHELLQGGQTIGKLVILPQE